MMESARKPEDGGLRGLTRHHVWKSRTCDMTVISLRDPSELLSTQEPQPAAPAPEPKLAAAAAPQPPVARPMTGKQESLNALLAKLQLCKPTQDPPQPPSSQPQTSATRPTPLPAPTPKATPLPVPVAKSMPPPPPPSAPSPKPTAHQQQQHAPRMASPAAAPSPAAAAATPEPNDPTFPDPKESSSGPSGQFEFIPGTNIPGQGVVKKADAVEGPTSMALFHDPLWGGTLDLFAMPPATKPSPKPQLRTSLSELYASAASNSTSAFASPSAPTVQPTPVASPPVPPVEATPVPTAMPPAAMAPPQPHMPMMGGMMPQQTPPQLNTPYPLYTLPIQYVAQQPQLAPSMVYNAPSFFPYGAASMMMAQPTHIPQGYAIPAAAMMRPGTNVKAMPFVPGSTM